MSLFNNFNASSLTCGILFLCVSCFTPSNRIRIEVNEHDQIYVNNNEVSATDLKKVLLQEKLKLNQKGHDPDKIVVETRINKNATIKTVGALNITLRELNIKKIEVQTDERNSYEP